jgi:predicted house-cleaning noncanonical NTP pyrophosphatase (MazG superfamily)
MVAMGLPIFLGSGAVNIRSPSSLSEGAMNPSTGKLIRDTVPQFIRDDGLTPIIRVAGPGEVRDLLLAKLREETSEVGEALTAAYEQFGTAAVVNELADVMEVLYSIAATLGVEPDQIDQARIAKLKTNGGFSGRIVWLGNTEDAASHSVRNI